MPLGLTLIRGAAESATSDFGRRRSGDRLRRGGGATAALGVCARPRYNSTRGRSTFLAVATADPALSLASGLGTRGNRRVDLD